MTKVPDEAHKLDEGFFYARVGAPAQPPIIDPNDFSLRKGLRDRFLPPEPSAVDRLAALPDPEAATDAARRVREWKAGGYEDPTYPRGKILLRPINPDFYGIVTVDNL